MSTFINSNQADTVARQCLAPLVTSYTTKAYSGMELAIFPSYFHGKCLVNGVEPDGCPNPDCPVVCGTPGSLVHFYGKLRYIAFNQTRHVLKELATPGSNTYQQIEQNVLQANSKTRRSIRLYARSGPYGTVPMLLTRREEDVKAQLRSVMKNVGPWLEEICGASGDGEMNGLAYCSWEQAMKNYILTFP